MTGPSPGSELLQAEIPELDLHRRADMHLPAELPVHFSIQRIIIDHDAHDVAVEDVRENIAARDDVILVPVPVLDEGEPRLGFPERGYDDRLGGGVDADHLAAAGEESAAALVVVLSGVA